MMRIFVNEEFHALGLTLAAPKPGDAGYDLYALEAYAIPVHERGLIRTGVHVEIPAGYVGLVKDRSSVAAAGLHCMAGVIDASYRGEIKILVFNTNPYVYHVEARQKIAQMVVVPVYVEALEIVETLTDLSTTERGAGGFGSTGR